MRPNPSRQFLTFMVALVSCLAGSALLATGSPAIAADFSAQLAAALEKHEEAQDFEGEAAALEALKECAETHTQEWLPAFWTAYVHTQVARLVAMGRGEGDPAAHLADAERYHRRAVTQLGAETGREASSLHALQSIIHEFRGRVAQAMGKSGAEEHQKLAREALQAAHRADPDNPVLLVFAGTDLIGRAGQEEDLSQALAGKLLLEEARTRFEADTRPRSLTTAFNSEWVPFWLPEAEKALNMATGEAP